MTPTLWYSLALFLANTTCWGLGLLAGYKVGRATKMSRKEAARVMAKASWRHR